MSLEMLTYSLGNFFWEQVVVEVLFKRQAFLYEGELLAEIDELKMLAFFSP